MPRSRNSGQSNASVAIFATILIIAGVVAVLAVSNEFKKATTPPSMRNAIPSSVTGGAGPYASGTLLLVNDSAMTLMRLDATSERVTADQFTARFAGAHLPTEGANVANGSKVYFALAGVTSTGSVSPDGARTVQLSVDKNNTTALSVVRGNEKPQLIVLRDSSGHAFQNVSLLGWLTNNSIALAGAVGETSAVYAVSIDGAINVLAPMAPSALWGDARGGFAWYATAVMGEGIESSPHGPSELHRISPDGKDVLVARDELRVFQSVIAGTDGVFAATTDDGKSFFQDAADVGTKVMLGALRPLLFLPGGDLVVRDGYDIALYNESTRTSRKLGTLPEGEVHVFFLP